MSKTKIIVVGAGIAGLTSAAILSKYGFKVTLIESHSQSGGCAGTFKRKNYVFDVGATQVAGLENGGIHSKIFKFLQIPLPKARILDPSCVVDLNDGTRPINIWHDSKEWIRERNMQFPDSSKFWNLCYLIHQNNWKFASNSPVLPFNNLWDLSQFLNALSPTNLLTGILIKSSMFDLLRICGCHKDERLIKFLNLQLKLYSQEDVFNTAALYGCTVLQMSQNPHGLFHLNESMQALSKALEVSLAKTGVNILFNEKVNLINYDPKNQLWKVITKKGSKNFEYISQDVVYTPPPQGLMKNLDRNSEDFNKYLKKIESLPEPSGALVFYSALSKDNLKNVSSNHYQIVDGDLGSLFISFSEDGDGRAPQGEITLIASIFSNINDWQGIDKDLYLTKKDYFYKKISNVIEKRFEISPENWLHRELATPISFERWTNRPRGIVGGLGQNPDIFGIFGLSSRTPMRGLWLCGDSIYPGEGTAGVSQSAVMVARQIIASKGFSNLKI